MGKLMNQLQKQLEIPKYKKDAQECIDVYQLLKSTDKHNHVWRNSWTPLVNVRIIGKYQYTRIHSLNEVGKTLLKGIRNHKNIFNMNKGKAMKKPIEINWFKWEGYPEPLIDWVKRFDQSFTDNFELETLRCGDCPPMLNVKTLEGSSYEVPNGYIIIKGINGEYYTCEPGIFKDTYFISND